MIQLNKKWKAKLDKWTNPQPRRQSQSIVVPGPVILHLGDPEV
jgi:hypothetical protein